MIAKVQHSHITTLQEHNAFLTTELFNLNYGMTIMGIPNKVDENCKELVQNFLKKVMKIGVEIQILKANCMGGSASSTILFYVAKPSFKGILFKHVSNLTDKTTVNGEFFTLREYLTGGENEEGEFKMCCLRTETYCVTISLNLISTVENCTWEKRNTQWKLTVLKQKTPSPGWM